MKRPLIIAVLACVACSSAIADRQAEQRAAREAIVHKVGPRYPHHLQAARIGGTGVFRMLIDFNTGKVTSVAILKSTGSDPLDREAVYALRQWRFKPGKVRKVDMPITFYNGQEPLGLPPVSQHLPPR
jgi:TonB family protein